MEIVILEDEVNIKARMTQHSSLGVGVARGVDVSSHNRADSGDGVSFGNCVIPEICSCFEILMGGWLM